MYFKDGQIIQWSKEKGQKYKQLSTKYYTENWRLSNTASNRKTGMNSGAPKGVNSSCFISDTCHDLLYTRCHDKLYITVAICDTIIL